MFLDIIATYGWSVVDGAVGVGGVGIGRFRVVNFHEGVNYV
jgi:hypothetical protein